MLDLRNSVMKLYFPVVLLAVFFLCGNSTQAQSPPKKVPTVINPAPTAADWAALAKLPDWSGVWNPKVTDQDAQVKTNPPPWNEKAASRLSGCLPRSEPDNRA